jgi:hypothetical protein
MHTPDTQASERSDPFGQIFGVRLDFFQNLSVWRFHDPSTPLLYGVLYNSRYSLIRFIYLLYSKNNSHGKCVRRDLGDIWRLQAVSE